MVQTLFDRLLPRSTGRAASADGRPWRRCWTSTASTACSTSRSAPTCAAGRIGLAQNRLPASSDIEDVQPGDVFDATAASAAADARLRDAGPGRAAPPARSRWSRWPAASGSRWTQGAGVVKALHPFCKLGGRHRTFIEIHLAKSRRIGRLCGAAVAARHHHQLPDARADRRRSWPPSGRTTATRARCYLSPGRAVGLRMIPMARDLRFAWEEMPQQLLDEQEQKVRDSLRAALIGWAQAGRRGQRLHRQPAAAVPAPGRPLVRGAEPAAQRRAGAPAGRAPAICST